MTLAYEAERAKEEPSLDLLAHYEEKIRILEVQSEINLPEVRIAFKLGKYPFRQPVYRHLTEQKWRKDGMLDLLMERIYQMHVVPDLLPELHPNVDLRIQFPNPAGHRALRQRRAEFANFYKVEPGTFLKPEQTRHPPRVTCTVFHIDVRYYTMLLLDPDVPDEATTSFTTYLHWMQPNIPLVASHRNIKVIADHTPYIPPHPQQGTPYHRYVLLLLPHKHPTEILDIPVPQDHERLGFNLREFAGRYGLSLGQGGGAHMWREVWDTSVSSIYQNVLQVPEPVFKRPRKPDPLADLKRRPRRPLLT